MTKFKSLICIVLISTYLIFGISGCGKDDSTTETKPTLAPAPSKVSETPVTEEIVYNVKGKVIVIDPGHGISSYNKQESIAPNSKTTKNAFVSGTRGKNQTEEQLNLSVALKLKAALEDRGAIVHMTRTEHNCSVSNIDRATFANDLNADISVKIHADGSTNSSSYGTSMLVPGGQYISDESIITKSITAGELILKEVTETAGSKNNGISVRNDLTGFNWSEVPVVLLEMGFMTNPEEDALLETDEYQDKIVLGILNGLELYFETK